MNCKTKPLISAKTAKLFIIMLLKISNVCLSPFKHCCRTAWKYAESRKNQVWNLLPILWSYINTSGLISQIICVPCQKLCMQNNPQHKESKRLIAWTEESCKKDEVKIGTETAWMKANTLLRFQHGSFWADLQLHWLSEQYRMSWRIAESKATDFLTEVQHSTLLSLPVRGQEWFASLCKAGTLPKEQWGLTSIL